MKQNTKPLKGFRDFLPKEKYKRDFILEKIITVFNQFGFEPLETPTLEKAEVLTGKYGQEADRLVYTFEDKGGRKVGLRYDQTVPVSRVMGAYSNELPKYFRRYQAQPVFRAEKPQKGRYREFLQCDIDIFGSASFVSDAEILACTYFVYKNIGFKNINLVINDRKILFDNLKKFETPPVSVFSIIQTIDKLDKKSEEQVAAELIKKGLTPQNASLVLESQKAVQITENLKKIIEFAVLLGVPEKSIKYTPTLARGLDYYTGMIFEIKTPDYSAGSLGGGGRYDNLVEQLSGNSVCAVGVAYGFDRTVEVADILGLIPSYQPVNVLVTLFDPSTINYSLSLAKELRLSGVSCKVYVETDPLKKQITSALKEGIKYLVIAGPNEVKENKLVLKNLQEKTQQTLTIEEATKTLKSL